LGRVYENKVPPDTAKAAEGVTEEQVLAYFKSLELDKRQDFMLKMCEEVRGWQQLLMSAFITTEDCIDFVKTIKAPDNRKKDAHDSQQDFLQKIYDVCRSRPAGDFLEGVINALEDSEDFLIRQLKGYAYQLDEAQAEDLADIMESSGYVCLMMENMSDRRQLGNLLERGTWIEFDHRNITPWL